MAQNNQVFQRVEKKYLLDPTQYDALLEYMKPYMTADSYGQHTICNIYYDTDNSDLIRMSLDKPRYKEKFRIRSYGVPQMDSKVFLEIKKKYKGVVFKRRASMTLLEAKEYLNGHKSPDQESQILNEIDYFMNLYHPVPKLYLAYDRIAFFGTQDPELRMTFDTNIRSREDHLNLEDGDQGIYLLNEGMHLLEIKISDAMPMWMAKALSELSIFPVSFSKYGSIYEEKIREQQNIRINVEKEQQTEEQKCLRVLLNQGT